MKKPRKPKAVKAEPLGHGSHWDALSPRGAKELFSMLPNIVQDFTSVHAFHPPWPEESGHELLHYEYARDSLAFAVIERVNEPEKCLELVSGFPILTEQADWIVRVDRTLDSYGAVEGVIEGETASGHPLQWFAPRFGLEAAEWRKPGLTRVGFAALALKVSRFDAKPIIVTKGPMLEMRREELRKQGKTRQAESPDLSVKVLTNRLRTFYSSFHDHHEFVGRVRGVKAIQPQPEFPGLRIDLPDEIGTGWRLPLYVFPPAFEQGFAPKRGDLIHGAAWLQGTWKSAAFPDDAAAWHKAGGAPLDPT
jgi:hypothetical protein